MNWRPRSPCRHHLPFVRFGATLREGLADAVKAATDHEAIEQARLQTTADWKEGVAAMAERRTPNFTAS